MSRRSPRAQSKPRAGPFSRVRILFQDESIVVVDKPAGLLTIATAREKERTLYAYLRDELQHHRPPEKLFIVHRLDREASGLLVFAKTAEAKLELQAQFAAHTAGRVYQAAVTGQVQSDHGTIRSRLAENAAHRSYSTAQSSRGKDAITHFRVLKRARNVTLLEVRLETGRKHQIRVHLAEQGHPILGDTVYGDGKRSWHRLALHGAKLGFKHPLTGERMEFSSPPPHGFSPVRLDEHGRTRTDTD